jgi:hypothetical protein
MLDRIRMAEMPKNAPVPTVGIKPRVGTPRPKFPSQKGGTARAKFLAVIAVVLNF